MSTEKRCWRVGGTGGKVGGAGGKVGGAGGKVSDNVLISSKGCENVNICPLSYQTGMFSAKCFDSETLACLIKLQ